MINPPKKDESQISAYGNPSRFRFLAGGSNLSRSEYQSQCPRNDPWRNALDNLMGKLTENDQKLEVLKADTLVRLKDSNTLILNKYYELVEPIGGQKVQPDQDITSFVIWYQQMVSHIKLGSYQELNNYANARKLLAQSFDEMRVACMNKEFSRNNLNAISSTIEVMFQSIINVVK